MRIRLFAAKATTAAVVAGAAVAGGLGTAGAASASPVIAAPVAMARCNVIMAGGTRPASRGRSIPAAR